MINNIVKENRCCGCSACSNVCPTNAIKITENSHGFLNAEVDVSLCIDCGLCDKVCPSNTKTSTSLLKCYALKLVDTSLLLQVQSGGAFFAIAQHIIRQGGVVYGVSNTLINDVQAIRVDNLNDLTLILKSKYVQCNFSDTFPQVEQDLKSEKTVFYSGTACVIQGLVNYLSVRKIPTENLLTCDLICHGVASRMIVTDYIKRIEKQHKSKVITHLYRDKSFGWGSHIERYELENSTIVTNNDMPILLSKGYSISPSCFKCEFTTPTRTTDLSIGDFWSLNKLGMSSTQFINGLSVVLVRNKLIDDIILNLTEIGVIESSEIMLQDAMQWNLEKPTVAPKNYNQFWNKYRKNRFKSMYPVYYALSFKEKIHRIAKNILRSVFKRQV